MTLPDNHKMSYVNFQYVFAFFALFSLFQTVSTDSDYVNEETLEVDQDINTTTSISSVDDEKPDNYEVKKEYMRNFNVNKTLYTDTFGVTMPQRIPRTLANGKISYGIECMSCYGNASSRWNCYAGRS